MVEAGNRLKVAGPLAAGVGSRWTTGAGVVKAVNPFLFLAGRHRGFLEIHLAKTARTRSRFEAEVPHVVTTSYLTHDAIARIHSTSEDVLESGMVFNIEPAAYFPGEFGMRQCNMVTVTETGSELLTDFDSTFDELTIGD